MKRTTAVLLLVSWMPAAINADVIGAGPGGFSLLNEVTIDAPRAVVWAAAIDDVGQWWNGEHSISGDSTNMSIDPRPQGCFCEAIGEHAGVVHLTVTFVNPNVLLRLTGGLGPLGLMGVNGNMTWEFFDAEDGTRVRFSYVVGGYQPEGLDSLAAPVDYVIAEALLRLQAYVESGDASQF
jgi:uncharacterized protein YndB with AHSA1/START domain